MPCGTFSLCHFCQEIIGFCSQSFIIIHHYSFKFTQLDKKDPSREFVFALHLDDDDKYEIVNCEPAIDAKTLLEIGQAVNNDGDTSVMVRRMRKYGTK